MVGELKKEVSERREMSIDNFDEDLNTFTQKFIAADSDFAKYALENGSSFTYSGHAGLGFVFNLDLQEKEYQIAEEAVNWLIQAEYLWCSKKTSVSFKEVTLTPIIMAQHC
mgnify:CR=1 FL=1